MKSLNIRAVPDDIHGEFKMICIEKNIPMPDLLMELFKAEINSDHPIENLTSITISGISKGMRQEFKSLCASKRISMQERITQFIEEDLADADQGMAK